MQLKKTKLTTNQTPKNKNEKKKKKIHPEHNHLPPNNWPEGEESSFRILNVKLKNPGVCELL